MWHSLRGFPKGEPPNKDLLKWFNHSTKVYQGFAKDEFIVWDDGTWGKQTQPEQRPQVKQAAHRHVALLLSWSMRVASEGVWPRKGFHDEELDPKTLRGKLAGETLAKNWRLVWLICRIIC